MVVIKAIKQVIPIFAPIFWSCVTVKNDKNKGIGKLFTFSFDVENEADIEYFPDLISIIKKNKVKISIATQGRYIKRNKELYIEIINNGAEMLNHTQTHPENFSELTYSKLKKEIEEPMSQAKKYLGYNIVGFRAPHFGNLKNRARMYKTLAELGIKYDTSMLKVTKSKICLNPFKLGSIVIIPVSTCYDHIFPCFDSVHMQNNPEEDPIATFKKMINLGISKGIYQNIYLDIKHSIESKIFKKLVRLVKNMKDVEVITYKDFVDREII